MCSCVQERINSFSSLFKKKVGREMKTQTIVGSEAEAIDGGIMWMDAFKSGTGGC